MKENNMKENKWIRFYLKPDDFTLIEKTIIEVEKKTSGEIVPMIVKSSSTVDHIPLILLSWGVLLFTLLSVEIKKITGLNESWGTWFFMWFLTLVILVLMIRKVSALSWVQRYLTPLTDQIKQVHQRAELEFYRSQLDKTAGSTGILLFVSLMERQAVVLADKGISKKLPTETWNEVVKILIEGARHCDMGNGFCSAILKCQDLLVPFFPASKYNNENEDELPNGLIIKD